MRILLVSPLAPPVGGMATWTQVYCDHCCAVACGVQVINTALVGKRMEKNHSRFFMDELVRNVAIISRFCKQIWKNSFDVIHINSSCSKYGLLRDMLCVLLAGKRKMIFHCHCNVEDQIADNKLAKKMLSVVLKKVEKVLVLNSKSYDYIKSFGCDTMQIVPNFIDREALADSHITRRQIRNTIYVGHIQKTKGLFELLEAAEQLPDIEFNLVGPIYENMDTVGVPANVHFLGVKSKEQVLELLDDADVFLFPSYTEGFSNALLEAMARGLPVVASDVGANVEMLENQGGMIIPAKDSASLVEAISKIRDADLRMRMSEWNLQKVASCYTTDTVMRDILAMTKEMF